MLIRRLIVDALRRTWQMYKIAIVGLLGLSWLAGRIQADAVDGMSRVNVFSLSMAVTWFLAFIPMAMLEQREIARLPVSRREFWIVRCWLSTAIPAGISAITLSLAAFASPALALDAGTIAHATFYSFI
jgi:hypothetical protein